MDSSLSQTCFRPATVTRYPSVFGSTRPAPESRPDRSPPPPLVAPREEGLQRRRPPFPAPPLSPPSPATLRLVPHTRAALLWSCRRSRVHPSLFWGLGPKAYIHIWRAPFRRIGLGVHGGDGAGGRRRRPLRGALPPVGRGRRRAEHRADREGVPDPVAAPPSRQVARRPQCDARLRARREAAARHAASGVKRRKAVSDLEERERAFAAGGGVPLDPAEEAKREDKRKAADVKRELDEFFAAKKSGASGSASTSAHGDKKGGAPHDGVKTDKGKILKVSWEGGADYYTAEKLKEVFKQFGEIEDIVIKTRKSRSRGSPFLDLHEGCHVTKMHLG